MSARWPGAKGSPERARAQREDREARVSRARAADPSLTSTELRAIRAGHPERAGLLPVRIETAVRRAGEVSAVDLPIPERPLALTYRDRTGRIRQVVLTKSQAERFKAKVNADLRTEASRTHRAPGKVGATYAGVKVTPSPTERSRPKAQRTKARSRRAPKRKPKRKPKRP